MPKIINKFTYSDRVDLLFDQYNPDSIKTGTRISRKDDTGERRKVDLNVKIPGNWKEFHSWSKSITELFPLISERSLEQQEFQIKRSCLLPRETNAFPQMRRLI